MLQQVEYPQVEFEADPWRTLVAGDDQPHQPHGKSS